MLTTYTLIQGNICKTQYGSSKKKKKSKKYLKNYIHSVLKALRYFRLHCSLVSVSIGTFIVLFSEAHGLQNTDRK